ncbi:sugar ABC transporter substrate-binding protein [Pectinatus cerevisiiphilus]|uniref:Monosaccharide ABC transporter substrate-binding protein (CUT2 family) n=1 Tax=Pectinatus cerevisiiphilus TaxID=86956 RepID=A0A4R3K603_9FIRM|nr:sugar ABC transporter substrate-binding protein [Pectinatus cerevisiiphilus]TCS78180.1 monosaccharide ABC transporter substrate-binding protein (CUT2 family) [Pectinatus cerevisiiphilus]
MKKSCQRYLFITLCCTIFLLVLYQQLQSIIATDYSAAQNEQRKKFGAVYMTLNNPFYEIIDDEIRTAVEKNGDTLLTRDAALSTDRQTEEVQELVDDGIKVLFLNAVDWQQIGPALAVAKKAGVPVIAIDTNVDDKDSAAVAITIVSDNYEAGVECAENMLANLPGGNIVLLKHSQAKSAVDRINGFVDTIRDHPSFKIIDSAECKGQLELAMPAMEALIKKHNDINVVMALNDPAAMGAMAALKNAGQLDQVSVYGVDGAPETKEMILRGNMTATAAQSPRRIGSLAASKAYGLLNGTSTESIIKLPTTLLTTQNITQYNINGWD